MGMPNYTPADFGIYIHGDGSNPRTVPAVRDEFGRLVPDPRYLEGS